MLIGMNTSQYSEKLRRRAAYALAVVMVQSVAAIYFLVDGIEDVIAELRTGVTMEVATECFVALALLSGVAVGARYAQIMIRDARCHEISFKAARGAMSDLIELRFSEWNLSRSEAEVTLFALKGSSVGEIASMRNSSEGTVRSQLSQVYAKAGVANLPMLLALFIDELVDPLVSNT